MGISKSSYSAIKSITSGQFTIGSGSTSATDSGLDEIDRDKSFLVISGEGETGCKGTMPSDTSVQGEHDNGYNDTLVNHFRVEFR